MGRALQIAHLGLLLAAAALCACGARLLWTLRIETEGAYGIVQTQAKAAGADLAELHTTLLAINRGCGGGHPCGTLADIAKTLNTARLTLGQVELAAHHENARIGVLDAQEAQIAADAHSLLGKAGDDLDTLRTTIQGVQPVESMAQAELAELQRATAGLTALTTDPDLLGAAKNLNAASANANAALQHVSGTTADVQQAVHSYLHPTWAQKIWHAVTNTGVQVGKFFF